MEEYNITDKKAFLSVLKQVGALSETFFLKKAYVKTTEGKIPLEKLNLKIISVDNWNIIHVNCRKNNKTFAVFFSGTSTLFALVSADAIALKEA